MTENLTCIGCPLGCQLQVVMQEGAVKSVKGNTCPRGEAYARKEVTAPTRIVTTTVPICGGTVAMLSVKTARDIPKAKVLDCIRALKGIKVNAPISVGQVVLADVAQTGVDVVATKSVAAVP